MSQSNYGVNFTKDGITIAEPDAILSAVFEVIQDAFALRNKKINADKHTPQGQIATTLAACINNKNIDILNLAANFDVDRAKGIFLDAKLNMFAMKRLAAKPTIAVCSCAGLAGTIIYGKNEANPSKAQDAEGNVYVCRATAVIASSGIVDVEFENETAGAIVCAANGINQIITMQTGWDTINNNAAGITGTNLETDEEFRARFRLLEGGNNVTITESLQSAALKIDGVIDAFAAQNNTAQAAVVKGYTLAPNSVALSVLGGSDDDIGLALLKQQIIASQNGNTNVDVIEPESGVSYRQTFIRPAALNYYFNISIGNTGDLPGNINDLIKNVVISNFNSPRVRIGSIVYAGRFIAAISQALNYVNVISLTIATRPAGGSISGYGSLANCNLDQYPVLDAANINITVEN